MTRPLTPIRTSRNRCGDRYLYCEGDVPLLFTENETNNERIFGTPNATPYVKDAINNYVVHGKQDAVNPAGTGTKAAAHYQLTSRRRTDSIVRLRLTRRCAGGNRAIRSRISPRSVQRGWPRRMSFIDAITPDR